MRRVVAVPALLLFAAFSRSASANEPIGLQPSSAWAVAGSGVGPVCDNPVSPGETDWAESAGDGVTLSVVGTNIQCCDCIRRSARFAVGNIDIAGAHLTGKFVGEDTGTYAAASFRVIMLADTSILGHKAFATQQRANNNCVGSSEEPLTIVNSGETFDIDLSTVNTNQNTSFDSLELEVLGYACPDGTQKTAAATATLSEVTLVTTTPDAGTVRIAPTPSPDVTNPFKNGPDVSGDAGGSGAGGASTTPGGSSSSGGCALGSPAGAGSFGAFAFAAAAVLATRRWRRRTRRDI